MLAEKVHNFMKLECGSSLEFYCGQFGISHIFFEFHLHTGQSGFTCCVINETNSIGWRMLQCTYVFYAFIQILAYNIRSVTKSSQKKFRNSASFGLFDGYSTQAMVSNCSAAI
jgi:hypothetical protein